MATTQYALPDFIADLDRITRDESSPHVITEKVEPLLGRLIRNPAALPAEYRTRGPGGGRGRYMLHRTPRFNITAVVWAPGDVAGSPQPRHVGRHRRDREPHRGDALSG